MSAAESETGWRAMPVGFGTPTAGVKRSPMKSLNFFGIWCACTSHIMTWSLPSGNSSGKARFWPLRGLTNLMRSTKSATAEWCGRRYWINRPATINRCGDAERYRRLHRMSEVSLYPAVKRFLESAGFDVKGEVKGCDIVAVRRGEALTLA